jgi:hypothetical protein
MLWRDTIDNNHCLHAWFFNSQIQNDRFRFRSFHPEVAVALRLKQSTYPVLQLQGPILQNSISDENPIFEQNFHNKFVCIVFNNNGF